MPPVTDPIPETATTSLGHRLITLLFVLVAIGPLLAVCLWVGRGPAAAIIGGAIFVFGGAAWLLAVRQRTRVGKGSARCPSCGGPDTARGPDRTCPRCGARILTIEFAPARPETDDRCQTPRPPES